MHVRKHACVHERTCTRTDVPRRAWRRADRRLWHSRRRSLLHPRARLLELDFRASRLHVLSKLSEKVSGGHVVRDKVASVRSKRHPDVRRAAPDDLSEMTGLMLGVAAEVVPCDLVVPALNANGDVLEWYW